MRTNKIQFSILDILIFTATVGIYLMMFMWSWSQKEDIAQALMIGGGSVLFLGKIFEVIIIRRFYELFRIVERHEKIWLSAAGIGMIAIVLGAL